jgi:hypothetical protein
MITPEQANVLTPEEAVLVEQLDATISDTLLTGERVIRIERNAWTKRLTLEITRRARAAGWEVTHRGSDYHTAGSLTFEEPVVAAADRCGAGLAEVFETLRRSEDTDVTADALAKLRAEIDRLERGRVARVASQAAAEQQEAA